MQQIADIVGCSQPTVSVVLNGGEAAQRIRPEVARTIIETAEKLGYKLPRLQVSARHGSSCTIGFLLPTITTSYWPQVVAGADDYLASRGANILLMHLHTDLERSSILRKIDGLIVGMHPPGLDEVLKQVAERIPTVALGPCYENWEIDSVSTADAHGGRMATEYMLSLGHRRIALVAGEPAGNVWVELRQRGYEDALRAAGIPLDESLVARSEGAPSEIHAGYRSIQRILAATSRPEAVVAFNDKHAMGVIYGLEDQRLRVPRDVAVIGYNDLEESRSFHVPLTTMREPKAEYGALACHRVLELIRLRASGASPEPTRHQLAPTLVVRMSCGARFKGNTRMPWASIFDLGEQK